ncbi:MAG: hypothetical protein IJY12_05135 [Clostridia bacterium]|nr:hypothetical protein [Clostridia bacterium]
MVHEATFNSDNYPNGQIIELACGHISLTEIKFVNENVTVNVEAKTGKVDFYDSETKKCLSTKIELPLSGDEKFSEVKCIVEGEQIKVGFPQYNYKDNYPHCDGEHDRWTKIISDFNLLCYDFKNNRIVEQ